MKIFIIICYLLKMQNSKDNEIHIHWDKLLYPEDLFNSLTSQKVKDKKI
jgi:hypothetical protein